MKKLTIMNEKGGVGKSFVASQFAFYCALKLKGLRVAVFDFDQQGNTSSCLEESNLCTVSSINTAQILENGTSVPERVPFLLVKSDYALGDLECQGRDKHNEFITHLDAVLKELEDAYDIVIFDTNPNPDVRAIGSLCVATHVLSPIQLNKEALDGVVDLFNQIESVREEINPELDFIGLLPNLVENKPFQQQNLKQLVATAGGAMIKTVLGRIAMIPNRVAYAEAQAQSRPVWAGEKSSARTAWNDCKRAFEAVAIRLNLLEEA